MKEEESKKGGSEEWDEIKREDVDSDDEASELPEPTSAGKQRCKSFPASMSSDNPDEDEFVMVPSTKGDADAAKGGKKKQTRMR